MKPEYEIAIEKAYLENIAAIIIQRNIRMVLAKIKLLKFRKYKAGIVI
jgi:hypothetical protein